MVVQTQSAFCMAVTLKQWLATFNNVNRTKKAANQTYHIYLTSITVSTLLSNYITFFQLSGDCFIIRVK